MTLAISSPVRMAVLVRVKVRFIFNLFKIKFIFILFKLTLNTQGDQYFCICNGFRGTNCEFPLDENDANNGAQLPPGTVTGTLISQLEKMNKRERLRPQKSFDERV